MKVPDEHTEQVAVAAWLDGIAGYRWPELAIVDGRLPWFAIPNGGLRNKKVARKLKDEGVKPGVPDLMLAVPRGGYAGMFVEMKKIQDGKVAKDQKKWKKALSAMGYRSVICRGHRAAIDAITEYLEGGE